MPDLSIADQRVWALEFFEVFVGGVGYEEKIGDYHGTTRANVPMSILDVFHES